MEQAALIMAGGKGTRFWPWSRSDKPKQFLEIAGEGSLLRQTFERLKSVFSPQLIFLIAEERYWPLVSETLPGFPRENFIAEPLAKNTAPCLVYAVLELERRLQREVNLAVFPADHFIRDEKIFSRQIRSALAVSEQGLVATFGIIPDSPHTGYGYIQVREEGLEYSDCDPYFPVEAFREKPDLETARKYQLSGNYYWNCGIFLFPSQTFLQLLQFYNPNLYGFYQKLLIDATNEEHLFKHFLEVESISIDYALMEKIREMILFPAAYYWNDVGSWSSVYEIGEKESRQNVLKGESIVIDSSGNLIYALGKTPVAVLGAERLVVVATDTGILISSFDKLQQVREVVKKLEQR